MHDPMTVAHELYWPWHWGDRRRQHLAITRDKYSLGSCVYHQPMVTIWHVDPETDHTDDSCDWFGTKKNKAMGWYPATVDDYDRLPEDSRRAVDFLYFNFIRPRQRAWWRHPRWHVHHWSLQFHSWQTFRRWAFSRCAGCGRRFSWGYSPVAHHWTSPPTPWFGSEVGVYHAECSGTEAAKTMKGA